VVNAPDAVVASVILAFHYRLWTSMSTTKTQVGGHLPKLGHATLEELSAGLDTQHFTFVQLVTAYKRRIAEVNDAFNAVLEVKRDAEKIAAELDKVTRKKNSRVHST
jgi:hypothetical protein